MIIISILYFVYFFIFKEINLKKKIGKRTHHFYYMQVKFRNPILTHFYISERLENLHKYIFMTKIHNILSHLKLSQLSRKMLLKTYVRSIAQFRTWKIGEASERRRKEVLEMSCYRIMLKI